MAKTDFKTVDEYIATHPENTQEILRRVRAILNEALPGAEEGISYQIPVYCLNGEPVIYFAGWKEHFSLYPATGKVLEVFKDELARYKVSKGTIRFPLAEPVPEKLIEGIAKVRAEDAGERAKAKRSKKRRS